MKVTFITGNQHKVIEARAIFQQYNIRLEHVDLCYPEIQGELTDVARYGAKYATQKLGKPVIVEDSGLFIRSLEWFPGTYSSYVQTTLGNEGILKLMKNVNDRYAEFRSVVGFATPKTEPEIFLGVVEGQISHQERGNQGFAYDPLFKPELVNQTFGELTIEKKNELSHRRHSMESFAHWFKDFKINPDKK